MTFPATNTAGLVHAVLACLEAADLPCLLFGGWAEEALGLRPPGPHGDIDLVYVGPGFAGLDAFLAGGQRLCPHDTPLRSLPAKRFPHKRAFLVEDVLCEILLVDLHDGLPATCFWGDTLFFWERPLAEATPAVLGGLPVPVMSRANLLAYRALHRETQPWRWHDATLSEAQAPDLPAF
ncbi:hypothetical protein BJF92_16435 [Rhizobium rhizosphaerae]|uniref:Nucleotidyltransferase family protein n=1 Tax=Xaviernesmea rhizosphaerae TaxID=1672749 RepID=A0A1Q9APR7_9HYPH|nr:hypothetical protein [Xaviernesmea rhizosphaerae]OLP57381.1 hypothetical protein BJF92_16435 [Xaviernesmea rhizosphaerae]